MSELISSQLRIRCHKFASKQWLIRLGLYQIGRVPGLFVPKTFRSQERIVSMGIFGSGNGEWKFRGTFVPRTFCSQELSFLLTVLESISYEPQTAVTTVRICFVNTAVWLTPTTRVLCSNAAKMRNPLKLHGVPQTNETISAASGPKFTILWGHLEEIAA